MSISTLSTPSTPIGKFADIERPHPRADGPRRRTFTLDQKPAHLTAYEEACRQQQGGTYSRREGLYSSLITEWRRLLDASVLDGKKSGQAVGEPNKEQAEIARLRREIDQAQQHLDRTETALEILGKHARSWNRPPRARIPRPSARDADRRLHRFECLQYLYPGGIYTDRYRPIYSRPPDSTPRHTHDTEYRTGQPTRLRRTGVDPDRSQQC